jgi:threonine dehydratase
MIVRGAARIVEITEDEGAEAIRLLLRTTHNLAEPAGAAATDAPLLAQVLAGRTPTV